MYVSLLLNIFLLTFVSYHTSSHGSEGIQNANSQNHVVEVSPLLSHGPAFYAPTWRAGDEPISQRFKRKCIRYGCYVFTCAYFCLLLYGIGMASNRLLGPPSNYNGTIICDSDGSDCFFSDN